VLRLANVSIYSNVEITQLGCQYQTLKKTVEATSRDMRIQPEDGLSAEKCSCFSFYKNTIKVALRLANLSIYSNVEITQLGCQYQTLSVERRSLQHCLWRFLDFIYVINDPAESS
jgi:hypothetical protein